MADRLRARRSLRTAVVWELLQHAVTARVTAAGRAALDVLDAGGGTGGFAVPLAALGHQVTVLDPSPDALAALKRRATEAAVTDRIRAVQADASEVLDLVPPGCHDLVVCHGVLEYVENPAEALRQLVATLRPAGTLSVLAANRTAVVLARALTGHFVEARHALADPAGRWGAADPVPRRFGRAELVALLENAGGVIHDVAGVRVFTDLVPGTLVDLEPGAAAALLDLETAVAGVPTFADIATQIHVLATRG